MLFGHEASLDPQALFGYLLSAHIGVFLSEGLIVFLLQVGSDFPVPLLGCQWSDILDIIIFVIIIHELSVALSVRICVILSPKLILEFSRILSFHITG